MRSHFFQTTISNGGAARLLPFFIIEMKKARIIIKKLREKTAQEQTIQEQGRQLGNMDFTGTVIDHGIVGKDIPIMARLAEARRWSKR